MRVVIRIRTAPPKAVARSLRPNRRLAYLAGSVLMPAALLSLALCVWRWSYDLAWTRNFPIGGALSHWQVWFLLGSSLLAVSAWLFRYAEEPPAASPAPAKSSRHEPLRGSRLGHSPR